MKKTTRILITFSLVLILSLAAVGSVSAGKGGNPKGTITAIDIDGQTLTLETEEGAVTVSLPEGFDYDSIAVEMYVVVRGDWADDDTFTAATVKETTAEDEAEGEKPDADDEEGEDDDDEGDEKKEKTEGEDKGNHMSVWCTDKKEKVHPMAEGIAETYGADSGEVMAMVCEGYSVGQIMLAMQTQEMGGGSVAETLAARKGGQGWGKIWKDAGLIGNEDEALPPGQAKKLENAGENPGQGKDKDNPGNGGTPPGQEKKDDSTEGDNDG